MQLTCLFEKLQAVMRLGVQCMASAARVYAALQPKLKAVQGNDDIGDMNFCISSVLQETPASRAMPMLDMQASHTITAFMQ